MRHAATIGALGLTLAAAVALYAESTSTRRLEIKVLGDERRQQRLEDDIAVLRAEKAWLARPSRIEAAARAIGMRPALERQYVHVEDIIDHGSSSSSASAGAMPPLQAAAAASFAGQGDRQSPLRH